MHNAKRMTKLFRSSSLPLVAALSPFLGRVRDNAGAGAGGMRSAGETRSADAVAGAAGAGSNVPVSVVRLRRLPWQRP